MKKELVEKTEAFLKGTFTESTYLQSVPSEAAYRLEHLTVLPTLPRVLRKKKVLM